MFRLYARSRSLVTAPKMRVLRLHTDSVLFISNTVENSVLSAA